MPIGGDIAVGELVEQMADPARQRHRQERGDHGKHDQSRGDANDLLPDGFPKHASRPALAATAIARERAILRLGGTGIEFQATARKLALRPHPPPRRRPPQPTPFPRLLPSIGTLSLLTAARASTGASARAPSVNARGLAFLHRHTTGNLPATVRP